MRSIEEQNDWRKFVRARFDEYYSGVTMDTLHTIRMEIEDELENFRFKEYFPKGLTKNHRVKIEKIRRVSAAYFHRLKIKGEVSHEKT